MGPSENLSSGNVDASAKRIRRGTDGGLVVERRAAKYKHNAGPNQSLDGVKFCGTCYSPVIIKSPSALDSTSVSKSLSAFAWVKADLR